MVQNDTKKREKAAQLIAEDAIPDEKIAEQAQISRSTLEITDSLISNPGSWVTSGFAIVDFDAAKTPDPYQIPTFARLAWQPVVEDHHPAA
jgi:hypothetical protein